MHTCNIAVTCFQAIVGTSDIILSVLSIQIAKVWTPACFTKLLTFDCWHIFVARHHSFHPCWPSQERCRPGNWLLGHSCQGAWLAGGGNSPVGVATLPPPSQPFPLDEKIVLTTYLIIETYNKIRKINNVYYKYDFRLIKVTRAQFGH